MEPKTQLISQRCKIEGSTQQLYIEQFQNKPKLKPIIEQFK
jgi:hypothetical protein